MKVTVELEASELLQLLRLVLSAWPNGERVRGAAPIEETRAQGPQPGA